MDTQIDTALDRPYDGATAFPDPSVPTTVRDRTLRIGVTVTLVFIPFVGLVAAAVLLWGRAFTLTDLVLAAVFYVVTGLGIAIGFHRGLTHRGFRMRRPLQLVLAVSGSMAFEGGVIDWVATHRKHHAFTDQPGDPHSPYRYGTSFFGQARGLVFAHIGWVLVNDPVSAERYAPDLLRDPMLRRVNRAFPLLAIASLVLPFLLGWLIAGSLLGGLTAFFWAGLARVALLQHVTWSINSICHVVGTRPFETRQFDRATNFWPLALLSFGESWHNAHHSAPVCARHGRRRWEIDPAAAVIRCFERMHWVSNVRWTANAPKAPESQSSLAP